MPIIHLVRHGRVCDIPVNAHDPQLGLVGHEQARQVAAELHGKLQARPILTSPLNRCRETAAPLAALWRVQPQLEPRVVEIPSPSHAINDRKQWLDHLFKSNWTEAESEADADQAGFGAILRAWRLGVCEAILACGVDSVIFTHFVPLNVVVGACLGQERVISFRPGNASVTIVETSGERLRLLELGREMAIHSAIPAFDSDDAAPIR